MSRIGVLGGMGPSATVDFMDKVIRLTPASRDQDHLPMIVLNSPQIPDRSSAILGNGPDPLPILLAGIDLLNKIGVGVVAIPCNSSHHWYSQMAERSHAPIIHIADACVLAVPTSPGTQVAIFATRGALKSGFYQQALRQRGIDFLIPDSDTGQDEIDACIRAVKAGQIEEGSRQLDMAMVMSAKAGANAIIMGCTEIPIASRGMDPTRLTLIDSALELARATVAFALEKRWNQSP
ncbi:MAG: amino acid racemase [Rhodoferax sp.]|jgi:aspartate racemase|nr:amino acid racemase [Rhodoferax sp.]